MPNTPKERLTRSNSVQNTAGMRPNLPEHVTKHDLRELRDDIIKIFKTEIKTITTKLQTLEEKIKSFETSIISIQEKQESHACQIKSLKEEVNKISSGSASGNANEIFFEVEERLRRRKNIVVAGIGELESGSVSERQTHDETEVNNILNALNIDGNTATDVRRVGRQRIGRTRLTRVTLDDESSRMKILRNAKSLRSISPYKRIFLNPDRTPMEQLHHRTTFREFQERKKDGEDVIMYRGKVILRTNFKNFRNGF